MNTDWPAGHRGSHQRRLSADERRVLVLRNRLVAIRAQMTLLQQEIKERVTELEALRRKVSTIQNELHRLEKR
jgi:uncharacterized protein YlxW (UPF0749 family)